MHFCFCLFHWLMDSLETYICFIVSLEELLFSFKWLSSFCFHAVILNLNCYLGWFYVTSYIASKSELGFCVWYMLDWTRSCSYLAWERTLTWTWDLRVKQLRLILIHLCFKWIDVLIFLLIGHLKEWLS